MAGTFELHYVHTIMTACARPRMLSAMRGRAQDCGGLERGFTDCIYCTATHSCLTEQSIFGTKSRGSSQGCPTLGLSCGLRDCGVAGILLIQR